MKIKQDTLKQIISYDKGNILQMLKIKSDILQPYM